MTTKRNFIKEFLKEKRVVGAISPSTKFLGEKMLENVDFERNKFLIELGPGTGVFTDVIIDRMRPDAQLLVLELNDNFYHALKARITDPRVHVVHDSAEFICKYLDEKEANNTDVIISSLPLMVLPENLRMKIINESYQCLKKGGKYIQFQYSLQSKKLLESIFKEVSIKFTIKNFPPAFVYTCLKDK